MHAAPELLAGVPAAAASAAVVVSNMLAGVTADRLATAGAAVQAPARVALTADPAAVQHHLDRIQPVTLHLLH